MLAIAGGELGGVADVDGTWNDRGSSGLNASHGSAVAQWEKAAVDGGALRLDRKYSTRLLGSGDCQLWAHARRSSCPLPLQIREETTGLRGRRCSPQTQLFWRMSSLVGGEGEGGRGGGRGRHRGKEWRRPKGRATRRDQARLKMKMPPMPNARRSLCLSFFVGGRRRADNSTRNNSERCGKSGSRERGARCFIQPTSRARPEPEPSRSCRVVNVHGRPVPARFPRAAMLGTRTVSELQNGGINRA